MTDADCIRRAVAFIKRHPEKAPVEYRACLLALLTGGSPPKSDDAIAANAPPEPTR